MIMRYDPEVDILDITLARGTITHTKEIGPDLLLDVDADETPLSLEILGASRRYGPTELSKIAASPRKEKV